MQIKSLLNIFNGIILRCKLISVCELRKLNVVVALHKNLLTKKLYRWKNWIAKANKHSLFNLKNLRNFESAPIKQIN